MVEGRGTACFWGFGRVGKEIYTGITQIGKSFNTVKLYSDIGMDKRVLIIFFLFVKVCSPIFSSEKSKYEFMNYLVADIEKWC